MATHAQGGEAAPSSLPDVLPFDLPHVTRQSWQLGSRVVDDAARIGEWHHDGGGWVLTAFEATDQTLVLRLRTPVGRSRFYGAIGTEFRDALPSLAAAPSWDAVDPAADQARTTQ